MIGRPSRRLESGQGALLEVRQWSRALLEIWGPLWRFGCGREALLEVQKWSGDPLGGPEVVGGPPRGAAVVEGPSQRCGSCRGGLLEVREWSVGPP